MTTKCITACDRCKKEIDERLMACEVNLTNPNESRLLVEKHKNYDLCVECYNIINQLVKDNIYV